VYHRSPPFHRAKTLPSRNHTFLTSRAFFLSKKVAKLGMILNKGPNSEGNNDDDSTFSHDYRVGTWHGNHWIR
jgi:hypothetical protein